MQTMPDKVTTTAAYVTSGATFISGSVSLNEWLTIGGFILAVLTFLVNFYFQKKRDIREDKAWRKTYGAPDD